MFIDEITIEARAGKGGDGVVRWLRERSRPLGGPAGGNGGRGGNVCFRAVRNNNVLANYTGAKLFEAQHGEAGFGKSRYGKDGADVIIDVPVGSIVTNVETGRRFELFEADTIICALKGGAGGLGNEHFKSSTNRTPLEHTKGKKGESAIFRIEVELVVAVGIIGEPNAGKSTLLNAITRAQSRVGDYPFTTLEPHLGDLYGFTLADIPGLIEGASLGKGLGHKFLRHIRRTEMIVHCVSLEEHDPLLSYTRVRRELESFDAEILKKTEWVVLTKQDLVDAEKATETRSAFEKQGLRTFVISQSDAASIKVFQDALIEELRARDRSTIPA